MKLLIDKTLCTPAMPMSLPLDFEPLNPLVVVKPSTCACERSHGYKGIAPSGHRLNFSLMVNTMYPLLRRKVRLFLEVCSREKYIYNDMS